MPRAILKARLVDNTDASAKCSESLGGTFRPRNVAGNDCHIAALVNEMAEVCLFVPCAEFPKKLNTRVVKIRFFDLACRFGAVERRDMVTGEKIRYGSCGEHFMIVDFRLNEHSLTVSRTASVAFNWRTYADLQ